MAKNQKANACAQGCKAASGHSLPPTNEGQCRTEIKNFSARLWGSSFNHSLIYIHTQRSIIWKYICIHTPGYKANAARHPAFCHYTRVLFNKTNRICIKKKIQKFVISMNDHWNLFSLEGSGIANHRCSICKRATTFMAEFWKVKIFIPCKLPFHCEMRFS